MEEGGESERVREREKESQRAVFLTLVVLPAVVKLLSVSEVRDQSGKLGRNLSELQFQFGSQFIFLHDYYHISRAFQ